MKINLNHIDESKPKTISLVGTESWLDATYDVFSKVQGKKKPLISGSLTLSRLGVLVRLQGQLRYQPYVSCSRCDQEVTWPIQKTFTCEYAIDDQGLARSVSRDDEPGSNDYICEGAFLDLASICNEVIVLSIPNQTFCADAVGGASDCGLGMVGDRVYPPIAQGTRDATHPFAKLMQLQLK